jgi:hypothetical protein
MEIPLLYLAAKPSHVGADGDRLACPLHRPIVCGHQTRGGGSFLIDAALSCRTVVGSGDFLRGASLQLWIFNRVLTVRVPERPNLAWRSSLLPRRAYPMSELSW